MAMNRRVLLKGTLAVGSVGLAASAGLLSPRAVLAVWPDSAFAAKNTADAMAALFAGEVSEASGEIEIEAPDIAENGAVVPVTVSSTLSGVQSISVLADKNATPLTASFEIPPGTEAYVSTRIKMAETGDVVALVKADGKAYSARKNVKVTIGGCGG
jgi:sulfur-oxidizing protein SoxY